MEGFRLWDIFRWKRDNSLQNLSMDATSPRKVNTIWMQTVQTTSYSTLKTGNFKGTVKKLGKDLILTNVTSGNIHALDKIKVTWDENRDYLWPIPASERVVTGGKLTQNPGWTDSTNFD